MKQRGRRSATALATVPDLTGRLPALVPPATLTAGELVVWRRTVERSPRGWFAPEQVDLLALYCSHVVEAERLRQAARAADLTLAEFSKLTGMAQRESSLALSYGRAMRLTVQSRMASVSASRRAGGPRSPRGIEALFEREEISDG